MRPDWLKDQNQSVVPCVFVLANGPWLTPGWRERSTCEGGRARIVEVVCGDCDVQDSSEHLPGSPRYSGEKEYGCTMCPRDDVSLSNDPDIVRHADAGCHHGERIDQTGFAWVHLDPNLVSAIEKTWGQHGRSS